MKKFFLGILTIFTSFSFSFADTLLLTKKGYSTYIQEEEFVLTKGINVIGPIYLQPIAETDGINVFGKGISLEGLLIENEGESWIKKLSGKDVYIEGEGRIIKGKVIKIKDNFIQLNTKKGYTITTLPKFPSRLRVKDSWEKVFAPKITLKLKSNTEETKLIKVEYPVKNLNWKVSYILKDGNIEQYIIFINKTPLTLENINIKLIDNGKIWKNLKGITIPAFSKKKVKVLSKNINSLNLKNLPNGKVAIYKNNIFLGYKNLYELK